MRVVTFSSLVNNLTFDQLATFKAIVECGSFKGAAERVLMTQPAISQRVKHMEAVLGVRLFDRQRGTSARLTAFGERLLVFADGVLDDLAELQRELYRTATPAAEGNVTIAAGPSYIKYRLLSAVQSFNGEHPQVDVRLRHSASMDDVLSAVCHGDAQLGIYPATPPAREVQSFSLTREELVLVAPADHAILELPPAARVEELGAIPLALSSYTANSRQLLEAWALQHRATLRVSIEADNLDTLKEAALQKLALAFLPRFAVEQELAEGLLRTVSVPGLPLQRRVWIIVDGSAKPSTTTRCLADYLIAYIHQRDESERARLDVASVG